MGPHRVNVFLHLFREILFDQVALSVESHFSAELDLGKAKVKGIALFFVEDF